MRKKTKTKKKAHKSRKKPRGLFAWLMQSCTASLLACVEIFKQM